jgi:hypothetical protein
MTSSSVKITLLLLLLVVVVVFINFMHCIYNDVPEAMFLGYIMLPFFYVCHDKLTRGVLLLVPSEVFLSCPVRLYSVVP